MQMRQFQSPIVRLIRKIVALLPQYLNAKGKDILRRHKRRLILWAIILAAITHRHSLLKYLDDDPGERQPAIQNIINIYNQSPDGQPESKLKK